MMARAHAPLLAALLLAAHGAAAQEAAPLLPEDPRAPRFRELERGFFTAFEGGWMGFLKTPTADRAKYAAAGEGGGFASGVLVGLQLGMDVGDRFALALLAFGANEQAAVSYGAFSLYGAGAEARVTLSGLRDSQQVERVYFYVRARGAFFVTDPHGLFGKTDVLVGAGPGIEYFTRLRHFSVGLAVDGVYAVRAKAPGIALVPTLRYTF
jgi:hypothetical protein